MINQKISTDSVGLEVAERLRYCCLNSKNLDFQDSISIAGGYSGLLILFSYLYKRNPSDTHWGEVVRHCVMEIKRIIELRGIADLSLFSGLAGVCFAIESANEVENSYSKMVLSLSNFLLEKLQKCCIDPICENVKNNHPSLSRLYDPIFGISGIGRYLLGNLNRSPRFEALAIDVTKTLVLLCQPLLIYGKTVPGWYLEPTDPINYSFLKENDKGNFNIGLAHGITGVLSYLSIAALKGIVVENQVETIQIVVNWIRKKGTNRWPTSISWEDEVAGIKTPINPSRDAWCYGVPGIARTLYLAANVLKDSALQNFAVQIFQEIFKRSKEDWQIPAPSLCHGIGGLLLITREMAREKDVFNPNVSELEKLLLLEYNKATYYGFRDIETKNQLKTYVDKAGMLEGATGVALTLLTTDETKSNWSLPFMIHAR